MKNVKRFLSENGYGDTTPAQVPNMGAFQNADIADSPEQTQSDSYKTGTDLPAKPKKKKK